MATYEYKLAEYVDMPTAVDDMAQKGKKGWRVIQIAVSPDSTSTDQVSVIFERNSNDLVGVSNP